MQKLFIGNPNPVLKQKYIIQKKIYNRANTRRLIGPKLANWILTAKERTKKAEQASKKGKTRPAIPEDNNKIRLIPNTPPEAIPDLKN